MNKILKQPRAAAPLVDRDGSAGDAAQPFSWPVRVYYEDTDAGGVVFYANYLHFMERARTEWLRDLGFEQPLLAEQQRVLFVVRAVQIDYLQPSRFNDSLQVTVEVDNVGGSRIRFLQCVLRGDEEIVRATVDVVCVNADTFKPARVPAEMRITTGSKITGNPE